MTCIVAEVEQVRFDELIPYIAVSVEGVPANVAGHNARLAAIELARTSQALKRTVWIDAQECVRAYPLILEDGYTALSINRVCYHQDLRAAPDMDCCRLWSRSFYFERPRTLYISTTPSCDEPRAIEVNLSVIPDQDSCYLDKWFYDLYAEDIAHGAIRRLRLMADEPWYNPQLAMQHGNYFRRAVAEAGMRSRDGNHSQGTRMAMPGGFLV